MSFSGKVHIWQLTAFSWPHPVAQLQTVEGVWGVGMKHLWEETKGECEVFSQGSVSM